MDNVAKALAAKLDLTENMDAAARELETTRSSGQRHPHIAASEYLGVSRDG